MYTHTASSYCTFLLIYMGPTLIFGQLLSCSTLQATAGVIDFQSSDINLRLPLRYPPPAATLPLSFELKPGRKRREDMGEMHPSNRCVNATVHWEESEGRWGGAEVGGGQQGSLEKRGPGGNEWMKSRLNVLHFFCLREWDQSGGGLSAVWGGD